MNSKPISLIVACTLFTCIGLLGGFMAATQKSVSHDSHGHEAHSTDDHERHDHGGAGEKIPQLSMQALKNLNVTVEQAQLKTYVTYRPITARIESTPRTIQPILAPIDGTVHSIDVEHGQLVKQGTALITLIRDAIPRPKLTVTGNLLEPEQRLKGLSVNEIVNIEKKSNQQKQIHIWRNSLKRFGYWHELSGKLLNLLPQDLQNLPLTVAVIGELTANGYLNQELVQWFKQDQKVQQFFFEIASFLLQGKTLLFVKNLNALDAFEPLVTIKVPYFAEDFDVHEIFVKLGNYVRRGDTLGELHNSRELHIEAHARGSEIPVLMNALENELKISAVPLTQGSGVVLKDLKIRNILDDGEKNGATVHLEITNNPSVIKEESAKKFRTWKIRAGLRYVIRVPQEKFENVFVLPSDAVVDDGAERVVFIQDGDEFKPANVVVVYQNDEVAVLSQDSDIFPGDGIVVHGAFGLGLALKAQMGGAIDPHAGHSH